MMTDEYDVITPEMASAINDLATDVFEKFSEIVSLPTVNEIPERLGDLLYFNYIKGFEDNIKELEYSIDRPYNWVYTKNWGTQQSPNYKVFDCDDWNRWYIDLTILNNIEEIPEQWNELNTERYKSIWNGNASLEWEE